MVTCSSNVLLLYDSVTLLHIFSSSSFFYPSIHFVLNQLQRNMLYNSVHFMLWWHFMMRKLFIRNNFSNINTKRSDKDELDAIYILDQFMNILERFTYKSESFGKNKISQKWKLSKMPADQIWKSRNEILKIELHSFAL